MPLWAPDRLVLGAPRLGQEDEMARKLLIDNRLRWTLIEARGLIGCRDGSIVLTCFPFDTAGAFNGSLAG
jgi:hypothetical protein